jgi:hypothetical protein
MIARLFWRRQANMLCRSTLKQGANFNDALAHAEKTRFRLLAENSCLSIPLRSLLTSPDED